MAVRFAEHWKAQTGHYPARLLFDGRVTTYAGLNDLEQRRVGFITIRRRGRGMLRRVEGLPADAWQSCCVTQAKRQKRSIQYVDEEVRLRDYQGAVRDLRPMKNWLADYWKLWFMLAGANNQLQQYAEAEEAARIGRRLTSKCFRSLKFHPRHLPLLTTGTGRALGLLLPMMTGYLESTLQASAARQRASSPLQVRSARAGGSARACGGTWALPDESLIVEQIP